MSYKLRRDYWDLTDTTAGLLILWTFHAVLAVVIYKVRAAGIVYSTATMVFGFALALGGRKSLNVSYICAYVVGAEVLWRMSKATVFYEGVKYAVAAYCICALGRMNRKNMPAGALLYFLLLLPGVILTLNRFHLSEYMRKPLSFVMSGPFALMALAFFMNNITVTRKQLWRMLMLLVAPIVGVAAVTLFATHSVSEEELNFGTESNKLTSGGFGPNQVSAVLGLGAAMLMVYIIQEKMDNRRRIMIMGFILLLAMQSAMTFSRGGLYAAVGSFLPSFILLLRVPAIRVRMTYITAALAALAVLVVVPYMMSFTKGAISKRFQDTKMSGREALMAGDLELFKENPFFGVGVAVSPTAHHGRAASHNEFTRLLAEHGLLGILALCSLFTLAVHRFMLAREPAERALVLSMFAWSMLFFAANGFRIAAPAFTFGVCCLRLRLKEELSPVVEVARRRRRRRPIWVHQPST